MGKCRAQIPSVGHHTWPYVKSLSHSLTSVFCICETYFMLLFIFLFCAYELVFVTIFFFGACELGFSHVNWDTHVCIVFFALIINESIPLP